MSLGDIDWLAVALRTAVYIGSIACAGGILFRVTVPGSNLVGGVLRWQIWLGAALLFTAEPLRYVAFQLAIAGGDVSLAFDASLRWMAFETPIGRAAALRLAAAVVIVAMGRLSPVIATAAAMVMIGSFAIEGHTLAQWDESLLPTVLLIIHLAVAHWWLGALLPLRVAIDVPNAAAASALVETFGRQALVVVIVLTAAGGLLWAMLAGWQFDLTRSHQLALAAKLALFSGILAIAARNKLMWTPMLARDPAKARNGLRRSLELEIAVCVLLLGATAVMTSFGPGPDV